MSTDPSSSSKVTDETHRSSPSTTTTEQDVSQRRFVEVAVPVPLRGALTYEVPDELDRPALGCRVRVPVGKRRLVGVVIAWRETAPSGFKVKPMLEQLDLEPVLTPRLLDLSQFMADYYLAPIGETVRVMLPGDLPPWGERRVRLNDAGALTPPSDEVEERLLEILFERRSLRLAELWRLLPVPDLATRIEAWRVAGRLSVEDPGRRATGSRYEQAVELRAGDLKGQLEQCGRSAKGRAVIEYLSSLGRPATVRELRDRIDCGAQVIKRLVDLELLQAFTQPVRLSLGRHQLKPHEEVPRFVLRPDQATAVASLKAGLDRFEYTPFLLRGMTGSGKTEVFLRAAEHALAQGRSALLLVPEIALVPGLARSTVQRFGSQMAILHSNLSTAERHQEWQRVRQGAAQIVLGPRSALFAPLDNIGLVVVDEEHEGAYKQDALPYYNGRDLALWLARRHGATALLVSATPSLESRLNSERGKLTPLMLTARAGVGRLPEGILVDLREEEFVRRPGEVHFSARLREEIAVSLEAGDQIVLLRNRRGYAPSLLCRACGEDFRCEDCGLSMTVHQRTDRLTCHYCGRERPRPRVCEKCGEEALQPMGAGTERVEERFRDLFPGVAVDVLDADASRRTGGAAAVLERFANEKTQVLIGTQMISKGHHFPRVALAGVLFADSYLGFPDFRAVERTYSLLTQLAGRAGRGERPGRVVIQTFHPHHYAIRAALNHDDDAFAQEEINFRRAFHYPPFTRMVQVVAQHKNKEKALGLLRELNSRLRAHPLAADLWIAGPSPAPLERLRGRWRFQLLLRSYSGHRLRQLVRDVVGEEFKSELRIDVDPYDLM